jgi:TfoX/Sxy family transcriptional regulator of competence genes
MPYDNELAQRIRKLTSGRAEVTEKKMFGGVCFFLNGNMLCGVEVGRYMFRVGKEQEAIALKKPGASPMLTTGRPLGGFVHVAKEACKGAALKEWLRFAEQFVGTLAPKQAKKQYRLRQARQ